MRLETVAESWATYQAKVLPPKAGRAQIEETRRAFYAGVYFCLMNLAYNIGDDSTDEEQGIVELEKLKAECEAFAATTGQPLPHAEPPPPVVIARQRLWTDGSVSTIDIRTVWRLQFMLELARAGIGDGREWIEDVDAPAHRCPPICAATHRREVNPA